MSIPEKSQEEGALMLVFHIGSSFVRGKFFRAQKSGIPEIIFSTEEPILVEKTINIEKLLLSTTETLQIILDKIYKKSLGVPKRVFCVLSSPWYVSQVRLIKLEKNVQFTFTTKLADGLIKKEISLFREENFAKETKGDNSFRIIEVKNIKTILNGYETPQPLNQKAKELEMAVFVSMGGESFFKKIENTIRKCFQVEQIEFFSLAMASFATVRDMYTKRENFLLVDVGGEVTDVFMTKQSTLRESITFPLGYNFFIREIAALAHTTIDEASSLFSLLKGGHMEEKLIKKFNPFIDQLKTKWLKQLEGSLAHITKDISIPSTIYLITDRGMIDFFSAIIKNEQFNQYASTESKFKIIPLDTQILHGVAVFAENVVREPLITIDCIYINRFLAKI